MKSLPLLACVLLGACASAAASARFDGQSLSIGSNFAGVFSHIFQGQQEVAKPSLSRVQDEDKAVVLIEYAVLPPVQDRFLEIFKQLLTETEKEEGVKTFGISRPVDENLNFYQYSEWDDMKAYGEHLASEHTKAYLEAISKIGVVWKLHILESISYIKPQ